MSILVIGEALIDIVSSPGSPDRYAPGGAPANVALGLGRLGDDVELLTDVGDDFHGGFLLAHLRESNVRVHARPTGSTSTARAVLATDGSAEYDFSLRWAPDASLVDDGRWSAIHVGSIATFLSLPVLRSSMPSWGGGARPRRSCASTPTSDPPSSETRFRR